jgi:outer membrane protein OmpA-like peptidoglycan-associated protein
MVGASFMAHSSLLVMRALPAALILAACASGNVAQKYDDNVARFVIGDGKLAQVTPRSAPQPPAPARAPEPAPITTAARLPAPDGPPPHALGFSHAVDGCLRGHVYSQPTDRQILTDDYADSAPNAELWGCEWTLANQALPSALPGAQAGQAFAVRYQGTFQVGASGVFRFATTSSSAMRLSVDGALVSEQGAKGASNDGPGSRSVFLGAGRHQVLIEYLAAGAGLSLNIVVTAPGAAAPVPFSVRPSSQFYTEQGLDYTGAAGGVDQDFRKLVSVQNRELELKGKVYFGPKSAELNREDESEAALLAVAKTLRGQPDVRCVEIQGHTDARGDAGYNLRLSLARAEAVRAWLVQAGVEPHRLTTRGFGGKSALGSNDTDAGRAANRRVQFLINTAGAGGSCPRGDATAAKPVVRERPAAPELVERACAKSAQVRSTLASELEPWLAGHRSCASDADCTQALPLQCSGKSKGLGCAWALVNQSNVEELRVTGARLDSLKNFCGELPEDHLVRSCGGCAAKALKCDAGQCQFAR